MDSPEFLQYFWDLGSFEEKTSVLSIEGIINCLDNSVKGSSSPKGKDGGVKSIVTLSEVKNGREDLEYTLGRLIKGLESQRECVRRGYSACLSIVLSRYNIPVSNVLEGLERHYLEGIKKESKGKASSGTTGDVRDRVIGLLLGYLSIIRTGFFKKNVSRPYIEQTIENLWTIYGVKMYLQDMVCEVMYLIVRDCCEYDPRLPIKYISSKLGNAFDARFLDKSEMSEAKRSQLVSQVPILSLFLKLRIFLEGRDGVVIKGAAGCAEISQAQEITVRIGNKWEDWGKLLFNPGYPFSKTRWEIILANFQYFSLFSPRVPSLLCSLLRYILESPCISEKIATILVSDMLREIEESYFSGSSSPQKHYLGSRVILQVLIQLKIAVFSGKCNFSEKSLAKVLKGLVSGHSKALNWALKTSLNERNALSSFSVMFLQTLVDIITGRGIETHFSCDSEFDQIQDFSRFVFGTLDQFDTEQHKRPKSNSKPSVCSESSIRNLIPFMVNDIMVTLFWDEYSESLSEGVNTQVSRLQNIKEILERPILTPGKERVRLFWILLKSLMLKTGSKMKILVKMFSDLISQEEGKSLDALVISQGIQLIDEILSESRQAEDHNTGDSAMNVSDITKEDGIIIYWRKVQWVQNIMLEFVQVSFDLPKSVEKELVHLGAKLTSQVFPLVDSVITFGVSNEEWVENYRQIIFPRLEKILGKCTSNMVTLIEGIQDNDSLDCSALSEAVSSYMDKTNQLFSRINQLLNHDSNKELWNSNESLLDALSGRPTPRNWLEISCGLIENCLLIYYMMEDCNSSFISGIISSLIQSREKQDKKLETILSYMIKLDITNEGGRSRNQDDGHDEDDDYPSCLAGLNLLFQLSLRVLDISSSLDTKLLVDLSRKITQLPDMWNAHSNFIDGNEGVDEDESEMEAEAEAETNDEHRKHGDSKHSSSLDSDEISQLLKPNVFSKDHVHLDPNDEDEMISCMDGDLFISHLLNDEDTPVPPKYERQKEQKEQEKLHIQRINSEMQNKLRMLETLSLISELYRPRDRVNAEITTDFIRTSIILLEGLRLGCKHALYYSIRSHLTIFSDYSNKLISVINKFIHMDILKTRSSTSSDELGDLFRLLIHVIGKPIVEPQTMSRWSKKSNGKQLKTKMENYSRQFETLSINLIALIVAMDENNDVVSQLISQDLIKKWISQKRFGIVTYSFLTKLMYRIKNSNSDHSLRFLVGSFINSFEETVKHSKSSYQLREYTNLINHTLLACSNSPQSSPGGADSHLEEMTQVVVRMVDNCIRDDSPSQPVKSHSADNIKFTTEMQRLELLKSLISLSKSIITLENNCSVTHILQEKITESNNYLNLFNQASNSGKVKRQINKLRNIINSSSNKGSKRIKVC
ncbi:hypothetical protein OJ253_1167 [Cryptosporidium canis]|uniref:Uncharacterized protein n=1 Tax=Cryptosporidium canis TaxID=195482 RepID=A0A9D5DHJ6_9CRYT|nr:hypothetical protein OJ253_1167 [Cryptosporidium canis]